MQLWPFILLLFRLTCLVCGNTEPKLQRMIVLCALEFDIGCCTPGRKAARAKTCLTKELLVIFH